MAEATNRYLALDLAVRMADHTSNGETVVDVARRFYDFLEGADEKAPAPVGEASAAPSGKKPRASRAAATATTTASTTPAKSAAEEDLFGSASPATAPSQKTAASTTTTATSSASPSEEDDLFGETAAPAKEEKPKATIEQLRKALTECQTKHGHKDHALGVLKKFTRDGNPTISTLDEAKYQDVIDACAKYVPSK